MELFSIEWQKGDSLQELSCKNNLRYISFVSIHVALNFMGQNKTLNKDHDCDSNQSRPSARTILNVGPLDHSLHVEYSRLWFKDRWIVGPPFLQICQFWSPCIHFYSFSYYICLKCYPFSFSTRSSSPPTKVIATQLTYRTHREYTVSSIICLQ